MFALEFISIVTLDAETVTLVKEEKAIPDENLMQLKFDEETESVVLVVFTTNVTPFIVKLVSNEV